MQKRCNSSIKRKRSPVKEADSPKDSKDSIPMTRSTKISNTNTARKESSLDDQSPLRKRRKLALGYELHTESPIQRVTRNSQSHTSPVDVSNTTSSQSVKAFAGSLNTTTAKKNLSLPIIINHVERQGRSSPPNSSNYLKAAECASGSSQRERDRTKSLSSKGKMPIIPMVEGTSSPTLTQSVKDADGGCSSGKRGRGRPRLSSTKSQTGCRTASPIDFKHGVAQPGNSTPASSVSVKTAECVNSSGQRSRERPRLSSSKNIKVSPKASPIAFQHGDAQYGKTSPALSSSVITAEYVNSSGKRGRGRPRLSCGKTQTVSLTASPITIKRPESQFENPTPTASHPVDAEESSDERRCSRTELSLSKNEITGKSQFQLQKELKTPLTSSRTRSISSTPQVIESLQRTRSRSKSTDSRAESCSASVVITSSENGKSGRVQTNVRKSLDFEDKPQPTNNMSSSQAPDKTACNKVAETAPCIGKIHLNNEVDARTNGFKNFVQNGSTKTVIQPITTLSPKYDKVGTADGHNKDGVRLRTRSKSGTNNQKKPSERINEDVKALDGGKVPVAFTQIGKDHIYCASSVNGSSNATAFVTKVPKDVDKTSKGSTQSKQGNENGVSKTLLEQGDTITANQNIPAKALDIFSDKKDTSRVTRRSVGLLTPDKKPSSRKCSPRNVSTTKITHSQAVSETMVTSHKTDTFSVIQSDPASVNRNAGPKVIKQLNEPTKVTRNSPRNLNQNLNHGAKTILVSRPQAEMHSSETNSASLSHISLTDKNGGWKSSKTQVSLSVSQDTLRCEDITKPNSTSTTEKGANITTDVHKCNVRDLKNSSVNTVAPKRDQNKIHDNLSTNTEKTSTKKYNTAKIGSESVVMRAFGNAKKQTRLMPGKLVKIKYKRSSRLMSLITTPKTVKSPSSTIRPTAQTSSSSDDNDDVNDVKEIPAPILTAPKSKKEARNELKKATGTKTEHIPCTTKFKQTIVNCILTTSVSTDGCAISTLSEEMTREITSQLCKKSPCHVIHSEITSESKTCKESENDKDICLSTKEKESDPNSLHSIEDKSLNHMGCMDECVMVEIRNEKIKNNLNTSKELCKTEIYQSVQGKTDGTLFEKTNTNVTSKIPNPGDENNVKTNAACVSDMSFKPSHHRTRTSEVPVERHPSIVVSTTTNDKLCPDNLITDTPLTKTHFYSENTNEVQPKEFTYSKTGNDDISDNYRPTDTISFGLNSEESLDKMQKKNSEIQDISKPMLNSVLLQNAVESGVNSKQDIFQHRTKVEVIEKVDKIVNKESSTPSPQIKGDCFTPKRSSRLQSRSSSSTPKRFEDFFIPAKRKKNSPKSERTSLNRSITGEGQADTPLKSKGKMLESSYIKPTCSTGRKDILSGEICDKNNLPKSKIASCGVVENEQLSVVKRENGKADMVKKKNISKKKDNETYSNRRADIPLTKRRDLPNNGCDITSKCNDFVEKTHGKKASCIQVHNKSREKMGTLLSKKLNMKSATKVKLKGNWNDPLITETFEVKSNTNSTDHGSQKAMESKQNFSHFSSVTDESLLKMRIHRTSQSLAIASLQLSKGLDEDVAPSTSKAKIKCNSKSKGHTSRQKKLKKPKSAPRTVINVEDLMQNEELSAHAFTLWKSDKGWEVQKLHFGPPNDLETHLRVTWKNLPLDEHKKYFLRVLGALTDENKHSPGRLVSGVPAVKNEPAEGATSEQTRAQQVEIQTAIDRKLALFRQMSVAKQHNLLKQNFTCIQRMLSKDKYTAFSLSVKQALMCLRSNSTTTDNDELEQESRDLMFLEALKERDLIRQENLRAKTEAAVAVKQQFGQFVAKLIVGDSVSFDPAVRCQELRQALVDLQDLEKKSRVSVSGEVSRSKSFECLVQDIQTTGDNICGGKKPDLCAGGDGDYLTTRNSGEVDFLQELPPVAEDSSFVEKLLQENTFSDLKPIDTRFLEDFLHECKLHTKEVAERDHAFDEVVVNSVLDDAVSAIEALAQGLPCCDLNSPSCILSTLLVLDKLTGSKSQ